VEKVFLKKQVRRISVEYVLLTLYKMTSPVAASILQFRWQTASSGVIVDLTPQHSRAYEAAHVLTKAALPRHKLKAARRKLVVCAFLVHPERTSPLFLGVNEELAKGQMQEPDWNIIAVGDAKNRVQRVKPTPYLLSGESKKASERGNRERTL
jgi:hypothetical protein